MGAWGLFPLQAQCATWLAVGGPVTDLLLRLPLLLAGVGNPLRSRLVAVVLAVTTVALAVWGHLEARRVPRVRRVDIPIQRPSGDADGLTIGVLTETHFDSFKTPAWSRGLVAALNALDPDVVVHAGDLAESVAQRRAQSEALADVRAPYRFSIAGNHEYYSGVGDWTSHTAELGWEVLLNAHGVVANPIVLAGVDDPTDNGTPGHGTDLDAALAGAPDLPIVLLAHQPRQQGGRTIRLVCRAGGLGGHGHGRGHESGRDGTGQGGAQWATERFLHDVSFLGRPVALGGRPRMGRHAATLTSHPGPAAGHRRDCVLAGTDEFPRRRPRGQPVRRPPGRDGAWSGTGALLV